MACRSPTRSTWPASVCGPDGSPDVVAAIRAGVDLLLTAADPAARERDRGGAGRCGGPRAVRRRELAATERRLAALRAWLALVRRPRRTSTSSASAGAPRRWPPSLRRGRSRWSAIRPGCCPSGWSTVAARPRGHAATDRPDAGRHLVDRRTGARGRPAPIPWRRGRGGRRTRTRRGVDRRDPRAALPPPTSRSSARSTRTGCASQLDLVDAVAATGTPTIAVAMRGPWDVAAYPAGVTALATYSILPGSLDALAAVLAGDAEAPGRCRSPRPRHDARDEILEQPEVARRFLAPGAGCRRAARGRRSGRTRSITSSSRRAAPATTRRSTRSTCSASGTRCRSGSGRRRSSRCTARSRGSIDRSSSGSASRARRPTSSRSSRPADRRARRRWRSPTTRRRRSRSPRRRRIDLGAGPELAIAATKTYTTELLAIAALSAALSGDPADAAALVADPRRDGVGARARARGRVDGARPGRGRPTARPRARVRVRHRARVGAQAQGARPGLRRPVLGGRLRARAARAARARRAGPGDRPARSDGGARWSRLLRAASRRPRRRRSPSCRISPRRSRSRAGRSRSPRARPNGSVRSCRSSVGQLHAHAPDATPAASTRSGRGT